MLYRHSLTAEQRNGNTVLLYDITQQACTNVPAASIGRVDEDIILWPFCNNKERTHLPDTVLYTLRVKKEGRHTSQPWAAHPAQLAFSQPQMNRPNTYWRQLESCYQHELVSQVRYPVRPADSPSNDSKQLETSFISL